MTLNKVEEACDLLDSQKDEKVGYFTSYMVMTYIALANADITCQQIIEREKDGDQNLVNMISYLKENIDLHCFNAARFSNGFFA